MPSPVRRKAPILAALAACVSACAASPALAEEARYCVTCTNPDQTYICRVTAGGSKPSDALKLYCVIRTAREGHHASCSAVRRAACDGIEKVYSYEGPMPEDLASDPRVNNVRERIEQERKAFDTPSGDGPDTLVKLTGRAVSASRQRLRNARGALGGSSDPADQPLPQESLQGESPTPLAAGEAPSASPDTTQAYAAEGTDTSRPGFARRSYRCVMSLFRNCRGDPAETEPVP
jgi:hypothetical protein